MAIKVAMIGAGSLGFSRKLMWDILGVPELQDASFAFNDIDADNLSMVTELARHDIAHNKLPATVTPYADRRRAVADADYVISMVRVGGTEAFETDIEIPLQYGIDQCVGDTLCAGGIMYGQRNIACILDFCKDIREVAKPGALFLNYANPNCMNVWAANHFGKVNCVGLCHGVQGGHYQITEVLNLILNKGRKPDDKKYRKITSKDVDIVCAGINHQTWYVKVLYDGKDYAQELVEGFEQHPVYKNTEKVRIDMMKRFGYYSTESNGHLSEYVPWYRKRADELKNWIDLSTWINGETGGYLRVITEGRTEWAVKGRKELLAENPPVIGPDNRSHEHGSHIIEGLETGRVYRGHFIVINNGAISNLPNDAAVELPGYVDKNGINIPRVGDLPMGAAAVCNASISVQRLAVHAAVKGDVNLLKQAMIMDPLTGAVCTPPEIWQMTDAMLVAQAKWLPQYAKAIPEAKKRLASEKFLGKKGNKGAARLHTRTPAEIKAALKDKKVVGVMSSPEISALFSAVKDIRKAQLPNAGMQFKPAPFLESGRMIDARESISGSDGLVYARATIVRKKAGKGKLAYGADGPFKLWVNGKAIGCDPKATNPCIARSNDNVEWRAGENELIFALSANHGAAWGVIAFTND